MWRAAFCSIWCAIGIISLRTFGLLNIIKTTDFPTISLDLEIFPFILLGTLCGLLGALFINISSRLISLREQNIYPLLFGRFRYTLLIASVIALCTYQTTYTMLNDQQVINDMFQSDFSTNGWDYYNKGFSFAVFTVLKLIITILSLSTHIPSGTLYPLFTAGAVFGRLFEYLCGFIFSTTNGGVYAAVAAASLVAGTTHTISVAVIVFEITGQIDYFLPMIVSVLIASTVSSSFTLSIYDALLEIKGLPYLPSLKPLQMHGRSAKDIMDYSFPQLHTESTLQDLVSSIEECQLTYNKIPVVDLNGNLSFEISLDNAKKYIIKICEENKIQLSSLGLGQVEVIVKKAKRKARDSMAEYDFGTIAVASETCEELKQLLNSKININDTDLEIDDSPFVITQSTQLAKIHFLFIMLGLHQVYVTRKALLVGVITRESFTKSRTKN